MGHLWNIRQRQKILASVVLLVVTAFICHYAFVVLETGSLNPYQTIVFQQQSQSSLRLPRVHSRFSLKETGSFHQTMRSHTGHTQTDVTSEPSSSLFGRFVHPGNPLPNYLLVGRTQGLSPMDYREGAMIFVHHNKAAGTSVKSCLSNMYRRNILKRKPVVITGSERVNLDHRFQNGSLSTYEIDVFMGGYAFGLCRHFTTRNCSYFTFLRDPVDRIISSYFYCMDYPTDQLCGPTPVDHLTIQEWAVYQGSYFYRQLLVDSAICSRSWGRYVSCWFKHKTYFSENLTAADHQMILNFILENLDKWFSVIGLTEEYDTSIEMISHIYNYSFIREGCHNVHHNAWGRNSGRFHGDVKFHKTGQESHDESKQAMRNLLQNDADVMNALDFDIKIYDVGKRLFQRQKELFGYLNNKRQV